MGHSALGLYTDLYEIRMVESYLRHGMLGPATFSLFARPSRARPWLVAAGLGLVLDVLEAFEYGPEELEYLKRQGVPPQTLEWLESFEVSGELWAVEEGTLVIGNEPLLELTAPLPVAQLLETAVMNAVHYDTLVATKAARCVLAAGGREVVDFGFRRAHGLDSGIRAGIAAWIGGATATSNVEAGRRFGIPIAGTMAHSWIQAFDHERDAFRTFAEDHPHDTTLLVDTYDTLEGVARAIQVARELAPRGLRVHALRLDSEPLDALGHEARRMLDAAGLKAVKLIASGGLDEQRIRDLVRSGAGFDGFGIGSALVASSDKPALDFAYKLVDYGGRGRSKQSHDKQTLPGKKQVFRGASMALDVIELRAAAASGTPLLRPIWRDRQRLWTWRPERARQHAAAEIARLPAELREPALREPPLPRIGPALAALTARCARQKHA